MRKIPFVRPVLTGVVAAVALASALVFAGHDAAASYTGCLNVNGGTIVSVALGNTPQAPCGPNQIQVHLGGGDITSVTAGTGLQGGTANGAATLSVQPSYRLPQGCSTGGIAKWNGTSWQCDSDADSPLLAFGGFAEVKQGFPTEGVPDSMATIGRLLLPAGKYAIFAKIHLRFVEPHSELDYVFCDLRADSDFDWETLGTLDGGEKTEGTMSWMLLHEFTGEGSVDLSCEDRGDYELLDYSDAQWSNLRITAIKLGSFENVPLLPDN